MRSLTRRKFIQQDVCLCCGQLSFNTRSRVAAVDGQTPCFDAEGERRTGISAAASGPPVSQEELIEHVWDGSVDSFSNSIRVHISALRKKLRAALGYDPIRNRIGEGYETGRRGTMKHLSLQWRITLLTALLIACACVCMNLLLYRTGVTGMDALNGFMMQYQPGSADQKD